MAFDYFPNAPKAKIDWSQDVPELPVVPSTLPDIEAKLTSIIAKLDSAAVRRDRRRPHQGARTLDQTLQDASKLGERVDTDVTPELKTTLDEARRALAPPTG